MDVEGECGGGGVAGVGVRACVARVAGGGGKSRVSTCRRQYVVRVRVRAVAWVGAQAISVPPPPAVYRPPPPPAALHDRCCPAHTQPAYGGGGARCPRVLVGVSVG